MPNADNFQLHIYAALAEQEREFISAHIRHLQYYSNEADDSSQPKPDIGLTRSGDRRARQTRSWANRPECSVKPQSRH